MMNQLRAEFRKLFSVRSTYVLLALIIVLLVIFAFFANGYKVDAGGLHNTASLAEDVTGAVSVVGTIVAIIAVLLMTHEYRYNTIMHTLTLSNNRSKILASKIIAIATLGAIVTVVIGTLSPLLSVLGADVHHLHFVHQSMPYWDLIWRSLFFGIGYSLIGLLLGVLIRNQIGTIVVLLIVPGTVEGLLSILLKKNTDYLPFSSIHTVIGQGMNQFSDSISPERAALVFTAYFVIGWIIAWSLFLKRDAN